MILQRGTVVCSAGGGRHALHPRHGLDRLSVPVPGHERQPRVVVGVLGRPSPHEIEADVLEEVAEVRLAPQHGERSGVAGLALLAVALGEGDHEGPARAAGPRRPDPARRAAAPGRRAAGRAAPARRGRPAELLGGDVEATTLCVRRRSMKTRSTSVRRTATPFASRRSAPSRRLTRPEHRAARGHRRVEQARADRGIVRLPGGLARGHGSTLTSAIEVTPVAAAVDNPPRGTCGCRRSALRAAGRAGAARRRRLPRR